LKNTWKFGSPTPDGFDAMMSRRNPAMAAPPLSVLPGPPT
jgi:hypothetical protein